MYNLKWAMLAALTLELGTVNIARADYTDIITETFKSGATFTGVATFDNNLVATSITGTLTGYQLGVADYVGGGVSENLYWVQDSTFNYATTAMTASNWWLDVSPADVIAGSIYNNILFSIDFSNPAAPVFTTDNNVINQFGNNPDYLIAGSIQAVPEPTTLLMFSLGLAVISRRLR